jgi:hypothetical protein
MNYSEMHLNRGVIEHIVMVLRWAGHVARMEEDIYGFVGYPFVKFPVGRPRRRW